jgi:hypothetical protein
MPYGGIPFALAGNMPASSWANSAATMLGAPVDAARWGLQQAGVRTNLNGAPISSVLRAGDQPYDLCRALCRLQHDLWRWRWLDHVQRPRSTRHCRCRQRRHGRLCSGSPQRNHDFTERHDSGRDWRLANRDHWRPERPTECQSNFADRQRGIDQSRPCRRPGRAADHHPQLHHQDVTAGWTDLSTTANPNLRPEWRRSTREKRMNCINRVSNGRLGESGDSIPSPVVTSGMIEAGRDVIARRWLDFTSSDVGPQIWGEVLSAVFRAMLEARPSDARAAAEIASPHQLSCPRRV